MEKVSITVNGKKRQFVVDNKTVLLDLLRDTLRLTGTKQSCDRKGQCGACTVIANGKAVRSCLTKAKDLDDAQITTIEGLGTVDEPHPLQEAFVHTGAIQCGFCTPGMIMASKALLDENPDPTTDDIKKALRRNLCRCTGYSRIADAVKLAARFSRRETSPKELRKDPDGPKLGVSHPRPSAMLKACGQAEFTADIAIQGAAEAAVVHSPHVHALIKGIDTSDAQSLPGVIGVMTAKDIQGTNRIAYAIPDRPVLCDTRVRYLGDPVAAVLAETREQALAAARAVKVEYEELPVYNNPPESLAEGSIRIHEEQPNLVYTQPLIRGDAQKALSESENTIEALFSTQLNYQAPLEPEASVAYFEEDESGKPRLVVIGRSINIHKHRDTIQEAIGCDNLRYIEAYSGGQFGIKAEITSEAIAAALAFHFKRPVRFVPSLTESMWLTPKRHPFQMKVRLGADSDARITGMEMDMVVDNGAYTSIGQLVIKRALYMLCGSYHIPHLKVQARLVYTNNAWGGAARGAGPPQANFALESAIDMLARKVGMDPLEFRTLNSLKPGEPLSTGKKVEEWFFEELASEVRPVYERALEEAGEHNRNNSRVRRGVGVGAGAFGIGIPNDTATVTVELDKDDVLVIRAAVADPGEGNDSMLTQIASHILALPMDKIRLVTRDSAETLPTGPSAASRMTYMAGGALVDALGKLKDAMEEAGEKTHAGLKAKGKATLYEGNKKTVDTGSLDPETGLGPNFESWTHAIQIAEVEVDLDTGRVDIVKSTTAVDAGPVIHPQNLKGQVEGGMNMGSGFALREEFVQGKTRDWVTFKYPTFGNSFDMEVLMRESPRKRGTLGAIGIGEMTMMPTAPAIINAIQHAAGVRVYSLPATPEKVLDLLRSE